MKILRRLGGPLIFLCGLILLWLSHSVPGFATWYASHIYPIFPLTIGWFFSLFHFSVFEVFVMATAFFIPISTIIIIKNLCSSEGRSNIKAGYKTVLFRLSYLLAIIFLVFVLTAGINYNRESFADHIGITVEDSSASELIGLYMLLIARAEVLAKQIETDENGHFRLIRAGLYDYAIQSMRNLHSVYGGLGTFLPRANAPFLSRAVLSVFNISGFFSPWTMEAHYNGDMPPQGIPFIITHELAHVAGHMREDEANFIAYLASRNAARVDFNYSAVYMALNYTLNALRTVVSREQYAELFALLPEQIRRDFAAAAAYWRAFQGPAADMSTRVNDAYLRFNQQADGVQSYGRMVDLLLAYYRELL